MRYLTVGEVAQINETLVGPDMLGDFGPLEPAVMRPQQTVFGEDAYPDIHHKAAALMFSLARNHAFLDGNKRTALLATVLFYGLNGWWLSIEPGTAVGLMVDVAEGTYDVPGLAARLKTYAIEPWLGDEDLDL
jgi:death on curing protein